MEYEQSNAAQTENPDQQTVNDADFLGGLTGEETERAQPTEEDAATAPPDEGGGEERPADATAAEEKPPENDAQPEREPSIEFSVDGETRRMTVAEVAELSKKSAALEQTRDANVRRMAELEGELTLSRGEAAALSLIEGYAKASGGTVEALMAQMGETIRNAGLPTPTGKTFDGGRYLEEKAVKDWKDFLNEYPGVDPQKDFPAEVWEGIKAGLSPRAAYVEHENATLRQQLAQRDAETKQLQDKVAALQKNEQNRQKSPGGVSPTSPGSPADKDNFLQGLFGND